MITAYVKPTNFCNVGCTHCYLPETVRANKHSMDTDMIRRIAGFLKDMADRGRHRGAHILWHGGEPLTISANWFKEAGEILDEELPGHSESMQTSLIPLRPEHVDLFMERHDGYVGSSVDFSQRMIKNSVEAYHDLWMKKVEMARAGGVTVIPGVVPTSRELGKEADIVKWFVDRGFEAFNIDRYNAYGTYFDDRPSNLQHAKFLTALFTAVMDEMRRVGRAPLIGVTKGALTGILFDIGGDRWGGSCQNDFVVVEPDGSLNTCPDKSSFEESHGNISDGFEFFLKSRFRRKWIRHQKVTHKKDYCMGCENSSFCQSGCPITPNGPSEGEDECSGYKTHLSFVRDWLSQPGNHELAMSYLRQSERSPGLDAATQYGGTDQGACAA